MEGALHTARPKAPQTDSTQSHVTWLEGLQLIFGKHGNQNDALLHLCWEFIADCHNKANGIRELPIPLSKSRYFTPSGSRVVMGQGMGMGIEAMH